MRAMASIAAVRKALILIVSTLLGAGSALALVACGDSGPDPSLDNRDAQELLQNLELVEANVEAQSCVVAQSYVQAFSQDVDALPDSVDPELREALNRGALNLGKLIDEPGECEPETTTAPTTTEETTAPPTTTEEETTAPTTTEEPTTAPTTTEETTTEPDTGGGGVGVPEG